MAASRLSPFRTSSFFRIYKNAPSMPSSSLLLPTPYPIRSLHISPHPHLKTLQSRSAMSFSAKTIDNPLGPTSHPWPEWPTFLERLKSKGYFDEASPSTAAKDDCGISAVDSIPMDFSSVKSACLSFGRERFDIFRALSKKDIQAIVECGCPNLFRKTVNSAKSLRAYVKLDEGDVCSAYNLRGTCDRAYETMKDDEGARTVDIVAIDPLILSEGEKSHVRETVEASSRKLLCELIQLNDTSPDPNLPKRAVKSSNQKVIEHDKQSQNVEMKRGDSICPKKNMEDRSSPLQERNFKKRRGMTSVELHKEFGWVVLVLVLYVILNTYMLTQVYVARKKYNVPYPALYALESENPNAKLFNCVQRGHQNSLEMMPIFFVLLLLGGVQHPRISVGFGLFYVVTRFFYFTGYSTGNPENRLQIGEWNLLALLGHLALTMSFGIHLLI